jgi:hypothetical protein
VQTAKVVVLDDIQSSMGVWRKVLEGEPFGEDDILTTEGEPFRESDLAALHGRP